MNTSTTWTRQTTGRASRLGRPASTQHFRLSLTLLLGYACSQVALAKPALCRHSVAGRALSLRLGRHL